MDRQRKNELVTAAVEMLVRERRVTGGWLPPRLPHPHAPFDEQWRTFRALVNTREPLPASTAFLAVQDELLQGPIAQGCPSGRHRRELAQCYTACLDAATAENLGSIAFCCISTGVFGFPRAEAAAIAVCAVRTWLDERPEAHLRVIFNVFLDEDAAIYRELLGYSD